MFTPPRGQSKVITLKIMTMGAFTTGRELAKSLVGTWMEAQYTPGTPSEPKVQRIDDYDKKHSKKD